MSAKSSNNESQHSRLVRITSLLRKPGEKHMYNWRKLLILPLWVAAAFITSQLIVIIVIWGLELLHMPLDNYFKPAVLQTFVATTVYALTIAIIIGVPYALQRRQTSLQTLGLSRLPSWSDIGLAPLGFFIYIILTATTLAIATSFVTGFPVDQAQDIGFKAFGSRLDNILAFITLVVLAPLAEEVLFRGYLYGKLKAYAPAIIAALVTSLLFGIVHMQWNVGLDVFVLSLVLCGLRSLTGSIWAGVLVHMIKNALAYYILFISPLLGA